MLSGAATGLRFGNPDHFGNPVLGKTPFQRYDYGVSCELSAATICTKFALVDASNDWEAEVTVKKPVVRLQRNLDGRGSREPHGLVC